MSVQPLPPTSKQPVELQQSESSSTSRNKEAGENVQRQLLRHNMGRVSDYINVSLGTLKNELIELINYQFEKVHAEMNVLKTATMECIKYSELMAQNYEDIKSKIEEMEEDNNLRIKYLEEMEEKLEYFEKTSKSTAVEIKNIPKKEGETKFHQILLTRCIGQACDLDILPSEIFDVYRINVMGVGNPFIIVKFTTVTRKEEFIKRAKKLIREHPLKIGGVLSILGYPASQVNISEHLTGKTRRLFVLVSDFAKANNYCSCWCSYGKIFLRKAEGDPQIHVKDENHLESFKSNTDNLQEE